MDDASRIAPRTFVLLIIAAMAVTADALQLMGRPAICTCGFVELWHGTVNSSGTSQHLADWYTFSHLMASSSIS